MSNVVRRSVRELAAALTCAFLLLGCRQAAERDPCLGSGLDELRGRRFILPRISMSGFPPDPCPKGSTPNSDGRCMEPEPGRGKRPSGAVSPDLRGCGTEAAHVAALRKLLVAPDEIEEAVETLESLARTEPKSVGILTDLAAAYFIRGRSTDRPVDLLRSAEVSRQVLELNPGSREARFNLGLADEASMSRDLAEDSWQSYQNRDSASPWAAEALARLENLKKASAEADAKAWPVVKMRLDQALQEGDRRTIRRLITPFPSLVLRHVEQDLLGRWAETLAGGEMDESRKMLAALSLLSQEYRRLTNDPYLTDVVTDIERASRHVGRGLTSVMEGVRALGDGLRAQEGLRVRDAAERFARARALLGSVRSPLAESAYLGRLVELSRGRLLSPGAAIARLVELQGRARSKGYRDLEARALAHQGDCLRWQGRPVAALNAFVRADAALDSARDEDFGARLATRKVGILRSLGEADAAWKEAASALRNSSRLASPLSRHLLLAEAALTAQALAAPRVALALQSRAVLGAGEELARSSAADREGREAILGVALKERANFEAGLGDLRAAQGDLVQAVRLLGSGTALWRPARSRLREVEGLTLQSADPLIAIEKFTEALRLLPDDEAGTVRAALYFERAGALEQAGRSLAVEGDLRRGLAAIQSQESALSNGIERRPGVDFLSEYLARFRGAYELYLNLLLDRGRYVEAFEIAERSRVFEPLTFLREGEFSPREIQRMAQVGHPMKLAEIQRFLPRDTYIVEFAVLKDRIVAWIVGKQSFDTVIQTVDRGQLEELSRRLERQVGERLGKEAAETLGALDALTFQRVRDRLRGIRAERIVVVPDGSLRGVPMAGLRDPRTGRYLIEDFTVSSSPSATLFVYSVLRDRQMPARSRPTALLVGDPAFDSSAPEAHGLHRLAGAAAEIMALAALYGREAVVLTGGQATAAAFLAKAGTFDLVHFAGHSVVGSPVRSFLALAPSKSRNGFLYSRDLLSDLKLGRTHLVVLSACASAEGRFGSSMDLGSLVRPILAAGAPAIVASVWSVGDDRAMGLLAEFHRRYAAGADAASALRLAQLCSLRSLNPLARSVLSWASFEVIGFTASGFGDRDLGVPYRTLDRSDLIGPCG